MPTIPTDDTATTTGHDRPAAAGRPDRGTSAAPTEDPTIYLTFGIGGQLFALEVETVREILDEQPMAVLPEAPPDVLGLIDVRGEGVMVMDVSHRLGVQPDAARGRRIVVVERGGATGRSVGVIADQVLSVVEIAPDGIEPAPQMGPGGPRNGLLRGVARLNGRLVMLLDQGLLLGDGTEDIFDFRS